MALRSLRLGGPIGGAFVLAVPAAGLAGAGIALLAQRDDLRPTVAALVAIAGVGVMLRVGVSGTGVALLLAGIATAALNNVRLAPSVTLSDALLVVATCLLLVSGPRPGTSLESARPLLLAVGLVVLGGLLASLASSDPAASALNVARLAVAAGGVVLAPMLWSPERREVHLLAWAWIASASVSVTWGLLISDDAGGRVSGLATHSNHLALAATMALGPALGLAAGRSHAGVRALAFAVALLLVTGVVSSGSRAGFIGTVAVLGTFAVAYPRVLIPALGVAVAVAVLEATTGLGFGTSNAASRLVGVDGLGSAASDAERWLLLNATLDSLDVSPLLGAGFESALEAHNVYLQVWAGAGVIGLAGVLLLGWTAVRRYLDARALARRHADPFLALAVGLACGWLGYFVVALLQNPLWDRYVWVPAALVMVAWRHLPRRAAR